MVCLRIVHCFAAGFMATLLAMTPVNLLSQEVGLRATLEVEEALETGESVMVRFRLTNESNEAVRVLKWNTPLEGIRGKIFRVQRDGETVPYEGVLVKRGDPLPDDYLVVPAEGSVQVEVNVAEAYDFSSAGAYNIQFLSPEVSEVTPVAEKVLARRSELRRVVIPSAAVSVQINRSIERAPVEPKAQLEARAIVINNCSTSQRTTVEQADFAATFWTIAARGYLEDNTNALYSKWFGVSTVSRFATVLDNWNKIENAFGHEEITYNCGGSECQPNYYAYVWSGGPNEVFLCNLFWSSPTTGFDSQTGTLIHELSHEAADTDDNAYGTAACQNLATNDPGKAIENADNYGYFAEDLRSQTDLAGSSKVGYSLLLLLLILILVSFRRYWMARRPEMS